MGGEVGDSDWASKTESDWRNWESLKSVKQIFVEDNDGSLDDSD